MQMQMQQEFSRQDDPQVPPARAASSSLVELQPTARRPSVPERAVSSPAVQRTAAEQDILQRYHEFLRQEELLRQRFPAQVRAVPMPTVAAPRAALSPNTIEQFRQYQEYRRQQDIRTAASNAAVSELSTSRPARVADDGYYQPLGNPFRPAARDFPRAHQPSEGLHTLLPYRPPTNSQVASLLPSTTTTTSSMYSHSVARRPDPIDMARVHRHSEQSSSRPAVYHRDAAVAAALQEQLWNEEYERNFQGPTKDL